MIEQGGKILIRQLLTLPGQATLPLSVLTFFSMDKIHSLEDRISFFLEPQEKQSRKSKFVFFLGKRLKMVKECSSLIRLGTACYKYSSLFDPSSVVKSFHSTL